MTSQKKVRFGLIGYGLFGKHHANAIQANQDSELVAIAVKSDASQEQAKSDYPETQVYGDYCELIARDDLDVIDIVVPNHLHFQVASAAIEKGHNLFLEKPMALATDECKKLNALAESNQSFIAINHELRHSVLWGQVKSLIDQGVIGEPNFAMIELSRFPYRQGSEGWRWDIERVGNWILEEPIHFFDLARWYLSANGEPNSIYARANSRHVDHPELRDNFSATVGYPNGAYSIISQTLSAYGHSVSGVISGSLGSIKVRWAADDARSDNPVFELSYGLGDKVHDMTPTIPNGELVELAAQIEMLVECVRQGTPPLCSGLDGQWSTELCIRAQESVESGDMIRF